MIEYLSIEEIEAKYQEAKNTPSDIWEHLSVIREYADKCDVVCEMGVRSCVSLWGLLSSKANKVIAIDILDVAVPDVEKLTFICADNLAIDIEPVDFLHIDTAHNYEQLIQELNRHAPNVRKWIGMHDVFIFGEWGDNGGRGLLYAVREFLDNNLNWKICYHVTNNNGFMILERIAND